MTCASSPPKTPSTTGQPPPVSIRSRQRFYAVLGIIAVAAVALTLIMVWTPPNARASPVINDFWVDNRTCGVSTHFSFNVSGQTTLNAGIFWNNYTNSNSTVSLFGTGSKWANFTQMLPSTNCAFAFQLWVYDTDGNYATTGVKNMLVYNSSSTGVTTQAPNWLYLGQAISAVEAANNWSQTDTYDACILNQNVTSLQTMITNYANAQDWIDVLKWSAICNKIWYDNIPSSVKTAVNWALGNATMIPGYNLLNTTYYDGNVLSAYDRWSLYGYYYANQSWALAYNSSITSKWNITAAYSQFDTSVNSSASRPGNAGLHFGFMAVQGFLLQTDFTMKAQKP